MERAAHEVVNEHASPAPAPESQGPVADAPAREASALPALVLQAKLAVGPANDRFEREADETADRVTRALRAPQTIDDAQADHGPRIRRSHVVDSTGGEVDNATERVIRRASGQGSGLPGDARRSMESAFGTDFGKVRIHTGAQATELNDRIQAKAFTTGNDIFFRDGVPDTKTADGQNLLAHELTHTIQQGGSPQSAQRKVAQSTEDGKGPRNEIADAALSGDVQARAAATLKLVKPPVAKTDHPYWKAISGVAGAGKLKKKFKWGVTHNNRLGDLPGVPNAGGYKEYYINEVDDSGEATGGPTGVERLVVKDEGGDVFHTATHYGDQGSPAFTHLG